MTQAPTTPSSSPTLASATSAASPVSTPTTTASAVVVDPATVDACSLLDAAQIGTALGETVTAGVASEIDNRANCFYDVAAWPVPIMIPENSGVSISIWREAKTAATAELYAAGAVQQIVKEVDGVGDAAWWTVHEELPNVHINTENAALDVISEPIQLRVAFIQIPNPVGQDKSLWLADATELANEVLALLGR